EYRSCRDQAVASAWRRERAGTMIGGRRRPRGRRMTILDACRRLVMSMDGTKAQPVLVPAQALDPDERVKLAPVRPVDACRYLQRPVLAEWQVSADPAVLSHHRESLDRLRQAPGAELEQFVQLPFRDQVIGKLVGRGQRGEHPPVDLPQVFCREVHELGPVPIASPRQLAYVQPQ